MENKRTQWCSKNDLIKWFVVYLCPCGDAGYADQDPTVTSFRSKKTEKKIYKKPIKSFDFIFLIKINGKQKEFIIFFKWSH